MSIAAFRRRGCSRHGLPRIPWALPVSFAIALAAVLAWQLHSMLQSPGQAIRDELEAAAADLRTAPAVPSGPLLKRLSGHFPHRMVSVDTHVWPDVLVTLRGLGHDTCRDAASRARRIEGLVVVELVDRRRPADCGAANDMTWRIMP